MVLRQRDHRIAPDAEAPRFGTAPSCRLHVLFAQDCRKAVIFRRGPSRSTRLIAWDRATDTFEPGQWMRRASVYAERASLSPDGEYLLSFIGKFRPPFHAYSVLSRPPYFTALALWPVDDTWGGGGQFVGPREFVLDHKQADPMLAPGFKWPGDFVMHTTSPAGRARLERWRTTQNDWRPREQTRDGGSYVRRLGDAKLVATWRWVPRYRVGWEYALATRGGELALPSSTQWADFDGNGDIVFAAGGALDRLPAAAFAQAVEHADAVPFRRRLADFTDMRFEAVRAPYAKGGVVERDAGETGRSASTFAPRLSRVSKDDRRRRIADRKALRKSRTKR